MKLRNWLFASSCLAVFIGCNEKRAIEKKTVNKDKNTLVDVKSIDTTEIENTSNIILNADSIIKKSTLKSKQPDNANDKVTIGNPRAYYINDKEMRKRDSLTKFVYKNQWMRDRMANKGVTDRRIQDSIIWDNWQQLVCSRDSTHEYVPFSEYLKIR